MSDKSHIGVYRCPVPGCTHTFQFQTKYHCEHVHGMTKQQVTKKYGKPIPIHLDVVKYRENMKTYRPVYASDFAPDNRR